ncbi:sodium:proton antiporter, partial [Burkholderia pseudomallei]
LWWGWSVGGALVFGLTLTVATPVVQFRALEVTGLIESVNGRIAVGWLVVEVSVMELVLELLAPLAAELGGGVETAHGDAAVH